MLYLGHGLSHKARILSRFKKRFSSKNTKTNKKETFHIKPLAVERDECIIYSQSLLNERYLVSREPFFRFVCYTSLCPPDATLSRRPFSAGKHKKTRDR